MVPVSYLFFRVHYGVNVHYSTDRSATVVNMVFRVFTNMKDVFFLGFRVVTVSYLLFRVHYGVNVHYSTGRSAIVVNMVYVVFSRVL